jgi:hypothetical protein
VVTSFEAFTAVMFQVEVFRVVTPEVGRSIDLRNVGILPQH